MTPEQRTGALRLADELDYENQKVSHDAADLLRELASAPPNCDDFDQLTAEVEADPLMREHLSAGREWVKTLAAEPVQDVGGLEYRGNSVSYIHSKMMAYRMGIDEAWNAMREAGHHPDGKTRLGDAIRAALAAEPVQEPSCDAWPAKPLKQVQVNVNGISMMAEPERAYFSAWAMQENENAIKSTHPPQRQAEPQEPAAPVKDDLTCQAFNKDADAEQPYAEYARGVRDGFELGQREARIAIEDGTANEPVQEPVAWLCKTGHGNGWRSDRPPEHLMPFWTPLYTHPPQRQAEPQDVPTVPDLGCDSPVICGQLGYCAGRYGTKAQCKAPAVPAEPVATERAHGIGDGHE